MFIFFGVIGIFMLVFILGAGMETAAIRKKSVKSSPKPKAVEGSGLSKMSDYILDAYESLPEEYKAFDDLKSMLKALDVKYGNTDRHFFPDFDDDYYGYRARDKCAHRQGYCDYFEYQAIRNEITELRNAHKDKERAIELAGIEPDLNNLEAFRARLREETLIAKQIVKEIS